MTSFKRLFSPITLGPMTLRNRIVVPAHHVGFLPGYGDGFQRIIDYFVERAKGGAAMVTMTNYVLPPSWLRTASWGGQLQTTPLGSLSVANDPALVPVYARLANELHAHGAAFISQLHAGGRQTSGTGGPNFGLPLFAPSALPCPRTLRIPKAMSLADIAELVTAMASSAALMREAGADGVELFAAQGYLLSEFLSPHTNQRTDQYGGSLDNRMRIVTESLQAIRRRVGHDFVLGLRINGDDFNPGGFSIVDATACARMLNGYGLVDYLNVSGMTYLQHPGWIADITAPEAVFADLSVQIKAAAPGTPVCVAARIGTPQLAERILESGRADLIGMVRALIADPELPNKALRGDLEDIRQCTFSNQSCIMGDLQGRGSACLHNVAMGKEAQIGIGKMKKAAHAKRVLVVGGGPAGMAAARIAAERGHTVTLYEKQARLGGQNLMTSQIASRRGFAEVTRWQEQRVRRLGVALHTGIAMDAAAILAERPDAVVLATGSIPRTDGYSSFQPEARALPGAGQANVCSIWDVFLHPEKIGESVVLIDEDPHLSGAFTAEHLASLGKRVQIVTPHMHPGPALHLNFAADLHGRLKQLEVDIHTNMLAISLTGERLLCMDRFTRRETTIDGAQTLVLAMGNVADDGLVSELQTRVELLLPVGDCVAPRRIDDAILDGERAGWMI